MKTYGIIRILMSFFLITGWITAQGQRQMEVPGDNFSLEGALELFKKSTSPQEFERMLNNADTRVNNLDLNGDGYIDYIRVIDMNEGNVHVLILQAVISDIESQDVAVITLEKLANGKAVLQITGDEDIYGVETIIEPTREVYTNAGYTSSRVVVNVWSWPSVRYIYGPHYSVWVSPWGWHYRPHWWRMWRPVAFYNYYPYWRPYRHHYSVCYTRRVIYAHHIYRPHRTTSVIVHKRHNDRIVHYRSTRLDHNGRYRTSRSRSGDHRVNRSVRYDTDGRIRSGTNQRVSSRSSSNNRNRQQSTNEYRSSTRTRGNYSSGARSSSDLRVESRDAQERSASVRRSTSTDRSSDASTRSLGSAQRKSSTAKPDRSISSERSNIQRYDKGSSGKQIPDRTYGRSSGSTHRSSTSSNVQRSNKRPKASSNIQRSSGSSNVHQSYGNSNTRRSTGSTHIRRPSGTSSTARSSGSSSIKRSSGSSNVKRSSGNSGSSRSGNSGRQGRGRH